MRKRFNGNNGKNKQLMLILTEITEKTSKNLSHKCGTLLYSRMVHTSNVRLIIKGGSFKSAEKCYIICSDTLLHLRIYVDIILRRLFHVLFQEFFKTCQEV